MCCFYFSFSCLNHQEGSELSPVDTSSKDQYFTTDKVQDDDETSTTISSILATTEMIGDSDSVEELTTSAYDGDLIAQTTVDNEGSLVTTEMAVKSALGDVTSSIGEVKLVTDVPGDDQYGVDITTQYIDESLYSTTISIMNSDDNAEEGNTFDSIGGAHEVSDNALYYGSPHPSKSGTFQYGKFDYNLAKHDMPKSNFEKEYGSSIDPYLVESENTFKYDVDPEYVPVGIEHKGDITEVVIHNTQKEYTFAVGTNDAIQHAVNDINGGKNFNPYSLVKIDFKKHSGAHFFARPEEANEEEISRSGKSFVQALDNNSSEDAVVSSSIEGHNHEHTEDTDHDHLEKHLKYHPKDVYSVAFAVNFTDESDTQTEKSDQMLLDHQETEVESNELEEDNEVNVSKEKEIVIEVDAIHEKPGMNVDQKKSFEKKSKKKADKASDAPNVSVGSLVNALAFFTVAFTIMA